MLGVIDLTGGYEALAVEILIEKGFKVNRAEGRKIKNYKRSIGENAKSDKIDAKILAEYGKTNQERLRIYSKEEEDVEFKNLVKRLEELEVMLQMEKNRLNAPNKENIKNFIQRTIKNLEKEIEKVEEEITKSLEGKAEIREKIEILKEQKGVGEKVATKIVGLLSELEKNEAIYGIYMENKQQKQSHQIYKQLKINPLENIKIFKRG
jgi:transposase